MVFARVPRAINTYIVLTKLLATFQTKSPYIGILKNQVPCLSNLLEKVSVQKPVFLLSKQVSSQIRQKNYYRNLLKLDKKPTQIRQET